MRTFLVALTVIGLLATESGNTQDPRAPKFTALSSEDSARLDKQRALIAAAVRQHYGVALTRSQRDLPVLQKLIDESVFNKTQTYELQCLGVAFGDVLASAFPLRWVMITDEYGPDPTLRYKSTSANLNALTMISKRVEEGRKVNLEQIVEFTREQLADFDSSSH